jgi:glycosyltransferase involved in cell wall biosynthesis
MVGDGKEKANLQKLSQDMGLTNVLFLPPVAKEDMSGVMAAADACIAILKPVEMYKTTYPNKVFDYMAAGRPVLCAIDGVIREVIETAHAGIFVPPGNAQALAEAVMHLYKHSSEGSQMGSNGRAYVVQHFNRAILSDRMEHLLASLVKK